MDDEHPSICRLTGCLRSDEILNICDVKGDDDLQVFRLDKEKTIAWLKTKVFIFSLSQVLDTQCDIFITKLCFTLFVFFLVREKTYCKFCRANLNSLNYMN